MQGSDYHTCAFKNGDISRQKSLTEDVQKHDKIERLEQAAEDISGMETVLLGGFGLPQGLRCRMRMHRK